MICNLHISLISGAGSHNYCKAEILYICHCAIYKKHRLQLKREFSNQRKYRIHTIASSKKPYDIHLKSVVLRGRGLGQSPVFKSRQILLGFNRYQNFFLSLFILNIASWVILGFLENLKF
jgi:hypothetical protein